MHGKNCGEPIRDETRNLMEEKMWRARTKYVMEGGVILLCSCDPVAWACVVFTDLLASEVSVMSGFCHELIVIAFLSAHIVNVWRKA